MTISKVFLGADHGGYYLKEKVKKWLSDMNIPFQDLGAGDYDAKDDYPQFAFAVAEAVAKEPDSLGILLCRSGGGMTIAANKVKGIRAVPVYSVSEAIHAREHNDANVISLSGDWTEEETAKSIVEAFVNANFSNEERHKRRLQMISDKEQS